MNWIRSLGGTNVHFPRKAVIGAMSSSQALERDGYAITPAVLGETDVLAAEKHLQDAPSSSPGTRNLLEYEWCRALVEALRRGSDLHAMLPISSVAVQCTLFDKTPERNWLVPLHQDLSIPVLEPIEHPELRVWTIKEGQHFVQPPCEVLERLTAVRVHLDDCGVENGPLRLVPRSHRHGRLSSIAARRLRDALGEVPCFVKRGGALVFKPLVLHASSKASSPRHRRVLHFLFGPPAIGYELRWRLAI
jgi:Phytanoyl-CoA dioxygenase (PhyH)